MFIKFLLNSVLHDNLLQNIIIYTYKNIETYNFISFISDDKNNTKHCNYFFFICLIQQDSWEDVEEEKKDVEKPAEAPKTKSKPKKALAERIEEREVCFDFFLIAEALLVLIASNFVYIFVKNYYISEKGKRGSRAESKGKGGSTHTGRKAN